MEQFTYNISKPSTYSTACLESLFKRPSLDRAFKISLSEKNCASIGKEHDHHAIPESMFASEGKSLITHFMTLFPDHFVNGDSKGVHNYYKQNQLKEIRDSNGKLELVFRVEKEIEGTEKVVFDEYSEATLTYKKPVVTEEILDLQAFGLSVNPPRIWFLAKNLDDIEFVANVKK